MLPVFANLLVKFSGLQAILGTGLGTALGIALNPVVVAGASAESTPTAPVTTDPAERARKLANNTLPAGEMTDAEREAFSKAHGGSLWDWIKGKIGLGGGSGGEDARVKAAIIETSESVKKLADKADDASGSGVTGGFGQGGSGGANLRYGRGSGGGYRNTPGTPLHFAGSGNGGWEKAGASKQEVADYIRHAAAAQGIDPETAVRVAQSEGLGTYTGDYGTSFGPFQLHYGGSGIRGMNSGGLGDRFTKETGRDARDPKTWKEQVDYALKVAKQEGWGAWHGAAHVGIGNRQGLDYHGLVPPAPKPTVTVNGTPNHEQNASVSDDVYAAAKRVAEQAKHIDPNTMTADQRRAVAMTHGLIARYEKTHGKTGTYETHGRALPAWLSPGANGPITTVDHRDPRFAPQALDAAHQKLADAMKAGASATPVKVEVTDNSAAKIGDHVGKASPLSEASKQIAQHLAVLRTVNAANHGLLHPLLHGSALTHEQALRRSLHNEIRHGNTATLNREGDTFNIHTSDAKAGLDHAVRVSARRSAEDRVRNGQG